MRIRVIALLVAAGAFLVGCRDNTPEVPAVPPPAPGRDTYNRDYEPRKPLPPDRTPRAAVVTQREVPPPMPAKERDIAVKERDTAAPSIDFLRVYRDVGRPKIVVVANRSLDGQLLTVHDAQGVAAISIEPAPKPGEIDASLAQKLDIPRFEAQLSNWLANDGQVTIVPSASARGSLSENEAKDLEAGKADLLSELGDKMKADILIQVQARPLRLSNNDVRIVAAAIDIRRREALSRASVDLHLPLDAASSNESAHALANKLTDGMAQTWMTPSALERPKSILER